MKRSQGFILLVVLIFLEVSALLGSLSLASLFRESKMIQGQWQQYLSLSLAEEVLEEVSKEIELRDASCVISRTTESELLARPLSFWQGSGVCKEFLKTLRYAYVVEFLHQDKDKVIIRLTVASMGSSAPLFLQRFLTKKISKGGEFIANLLS